MTSCPGARTLVRQPDVTPDVEPDVEPDVAPDVEPDVAPDAGLDVAPDASGSSRVQRMVIAGDSWSTGLVFPTIDALADLGWSDITRTWEGTAVAGSTVAQWVTNQDDKLIKLAAALDAEPKAEVLLVTLGGNDMNKAIVDDSLDDLPGFLQDAVLDGIRDDLQAFTNWALAGRPHLTVVFIGYDFLHYEMLNLLISLAPYDTKSYNQVLLELETRKKDFCTTTPRCEYANNMGLLQHTYGDHPHPPFSTPLVTYAPGFLPAPGWAPSYEPFPGGWIDLPAPLDYMPDGIHPNAAGFRTIIDHTFAQGLSNIVNKQAWY